MKKLTFTILLGWLLFISSNLNAQNPEGRFALKEGDWFEIEVEQDYSTSLQFNDRQQNEVNKTTFLLNYQLQKQLPNGNQQYNIRLDHFKIKKKYGERYLGFDSYYPAFEENKTNPNIKNQFSLEVMQTGKIVRFTPFRKNKSGKVLTTINSSYGDNSQFTYSDNMNDSLMISIFSNVLMLRDSIPNKIRPITENGIPYLGKGPNSKLLLTDASFTLPNNTIIHGKAKDQINQEIKIYMLGSYSESYFSEKQFRTSNDGSFTCPIFMKRPFHLRIDIGDKTLTTFLEPGDTLNFSEIGYLAHKLQPINYNDTNQAQYFAMMKKRSDHFSGSAEYNTLLSNEINHYRNYFIIDKDNQSIINYSKETDKLVNALINSYQGKASEVCLDYFRRDWNYLLAAERLRIYDDSRRSKGNKSSNDVLKMKDYPADFFLGVDTIPILMNPFEWNSSYQSFIEKSQLFKQERLGWAVGKSFMNNFLENYFFAQASLRGYSLYNQIAKIIDLELRHKLSNFDIVKPYYKDFINNCSDPVLTEPLKRVYETAVELSIGNQFPLKSFVLKDSSIFNLEKLKGKPICLVLFDGPKSSINQFKEDIEKFRAEEVEFIFVLPTGNFWIGSEVDSTIWRKPNVNYIELPVEFLKSKLLLDRTKIFMLDKWFRIVENNVEDPMTHKYTGRISEFEKSLRKTTDAKRYSKAEKTALIKTTGWSFGSILFTFLIGLWIYRIRIRRIKTQEAARRRIKELEIKAIRSQMNPHFIFNALNSIQSLINGSQFKEANIYLSKFAVLLRGVLNNSERSRISLSDELQAVELYCQLEQLRFDFKFEISIDPEVNPELIEIPGMIIQPLAENAVVHGLAGKGALGKLDILVKRQNGNLCICVTDNGVGLLAEKSDTLSQKGFGLKLVKERINILNLDGKEARLTVESKDNAAGTVATLIIPID